MKQVIVLYIIMYKEREREKEERTRERERERERAQRKSLFTRKLAVVTARELNSRPT